MDITIPKSLEALVRRKVDEVTPHNSSMSRHSPEAVFEHARSAMARGDLPEVFACLDVNDLKRIAENAVALSLGAHHR